MVTPHPTAFFQQAFADAALTDLRAQVMGSLAEVLKLTFLVNVELINKEYAAKNKAMNEFISSHIEMNFNGEKACLTISIATPIVFFTADQLEPEEKQHSAAIIESIVCEVTNIISNHIRMHFLEKYGTECTLGLPIVGKEPHTQSGVRPVNICFHIKSGRLDMDVDAPSIAGESAALGGYC